MGEIENKDDDQPSNVLEYFVELTTIQEMIANLSAGNISDFEKQYEVYSGILSRYQEQPHLLDPHLPAFIESLLAIIRQLSVEPTLFHAAFKYLYQLSKVRQYKVLVKFLPHEITDLEFVLDLLDQQTDDAETWESRYMLLLWLSILVLNPFQMSRFDTGAGDKHSISIMQRIFNICKANTANNDSCASVAAFLTAKYLIRLDIKDQYLPLYLQSIMEADKESIKNGQLLTIASILKHGKREDLLPHSERLTIWLITCEFKNSNDFLKTKYFIKVMQRLGLVFLKPRLAQWRYQRGSRSLTANLAATETHGVCQSMEFGGNQLADNADEPIDVPSEIENIVEELLQGLRSASGDIRWSAAKGVGRVTSRLPKEMGDEVVGSVIEILSPLEQNEAWHGACLAIAELAKRGLLLPYRLETLVPLLLQALVYDEMKGYMSVGQHIRDAACYMCWAFARAYEPKIFKPFINKIAASLLVTTVFDREINCRRAASAAFQESVGRLRNFPHGIDILTKADFFSVGVRVNSYLEISDYISQYSDYSFALIDHLVERKVNHWDTAIRELSSKALHRLTAREPAYMATDVLPKLFQKIASFDVNMRHGSVLAIGEIVLALKPIEANEPGKYFTPYLIENVSNLVASFQKKDQFKGLSGEMMYQSSCELIRNCSKANIPITEHCIQSWQTIIDDCIVKNSAPIRNAAIGALKELATVHYVHDGRITANHQILQRYIRGAKEDLWEFVRMGYVSAIGALPTFILKLDLLSLYSTLIFCALTPIDRRTIMTNNELADMVDNATEANWSEARRDSVKALSNVVETFGFEKTQWLDVVELDKVVNCYLVALQEYTIDNRGDIGAWVREAAMVALSKLIVACPAQMMKSEWVHALTTGLLQQAVEKIDRTRALAGKLFCRVIQCDKLKPYIAHHSFLKNIFPEENPNILWLHANHTFPLFCELLVLPEYTECLLIGLIASIGQLTESLIKYSSNSMIQVLRNHPDQIARICNCIVHIFEKNLFNERITYPLLNFLSLLIASGAVNSVLLNENNTFSAEIFRLTKLEIKGHKKLYKLISSISVFCQLVQVASLSSKILSYLSILLGLTHVHVRKCTASKLYEALILYGDTIGIPEENFDEVMNCLSETDWGLPLNEVRPKRNNLCTLMGIKAPVSTVTVANK